MFDVFAIHYLFLGGAFLCFPSMDSGMRVPNLASLLRHVRKQGRETAEAPRLSLCEFVSRTKKLLREFSATTQADQSCSMRKTSDII